MCPSKKRYKAPNRIPIEIDGFQINTCRNHLCTNFGKKPSQDVKRGRGGIVDGYRTTGGWGTRSIYCIQCKKSFTSKSNLAIMEEYERLLSPYQDIKLPSCKNESCDNHKKSVSDFPSYYQSFGITDIGSQRYRCKICTKTFSFNTKATHRQRKPELNVFILKSLINKVPMRRICELVDINSPLLYQRLGFFKDRCQLFAQKHEKKLLDGFAISKLRLAVDRQEYVLNWDSQFDRKNTKLSAIGSADNISGFVFGMHLDYDPSINIFEADLHSRELNDFEIDPSQRIYSRIYLPDTDLLEPNIKLPSTGARIHKEYTMFAHFLLLRDLFQGVKNISFYLDQEANINSACLLAFKNGVISGNVNAFYIQINKSLTINEKRLVMAKRTRMFKDDENEWLKAREIVKDEYNKKVNMEESQKTIWINHPLPNMGEPEKKICHITTKFEKCSDSLSDELLFGSLNSIDRFFMVLRRRISLLERPITSASATGRSWYGSSPYSPDVVAKILYVFRVVYNYSLKGKDKKTPAMRLGIVNKAYTLEELLS